MNDKKQTALKAAKKELEASGVQLGVIWARTDRVLDCVEDAFNDLELCNDKVYQSLVEVHFAVERTIKQIGDILINK